MTFLLKKRLMTVAWCGLLSPTAWAQCEKPITVSEIVQCIYQNHPDMVRRHASLEQSDVLVNEAKQRPNPEINGRTLRGSNSGLTSASTELNLTHTVELGGKRSARIERAQAEKSNVEAQALKTQEDVTIDSMLILIRLRQLTTEQATLDEALGTFSKIQSQYRNRPRLDPEQTVSESVFALAQNDYRIRKTELEIERDILRERLKLLIGVSRLDLSDSILPPWTTRWPEVQDQQSSWQGSSARLYDAQVKLSQADLELERSEAWTNLRVGPSLDLGKSGIQSVKQWGLNASLNLPLLHFNGGGKQVARTGLILAERSRDVAKNQLEVEHKNWITRYRRGVDSLKLSIQFEELDRRHHKMENLFGRGLVPTTLIIEAHRQMVDLNRTQNTQERQTLEALWRLYALEGRLFQEVL